MMTLIKKNAIHEWLQEWVLKRNQCILNKKSSPLLNITHNEIKAKCDEGYYMYNKKFISTILIYVQEIYNNNNNEKNHYWEKCIMLLKKLEQNFELCSLNLLKSLEEYPNIEKSKELFENYGRVLMDYYFHNNYCFLTQWFLLYIQMQKYEDDIEPMLKRKLLQLINIITSINDDIKWLEFLHGRLLNINVAMIAHKDFCNKYKKNICYDIDDDNEMELIIHNLAQYLNNIYDCKFNTDNDLKNPINPIIQYPGLLYYKNIYKDNENNILQNDDNNDDKNNNYKNKNLIRYYQLYKNILNYIENNLELGTKLDYLITIIMSFLNDTLPLSPVSSSSSLLSEIDTQEDKDINCNSQNDMSIITND